MQCALVEGLKWAARCSGTCLLTASMGRATVVDADGVPVYQGNAISVRHNEVDHLYPAPSSDVEGLAMLAHWKSQAAADHRRADWPVF
jgi:hypothetical protein